MRLLKKKNKKNITNASYEKPKDMKKAIKYFVALLNEYKATVTITVLSNIVSTVLFALVPWIIAVVVDDVIKVMTNQSIINKWPTIQDTITMPIIYILMIAVVNFGLNYYQEYQMAKIGESVSLSLRKKLTEKMNKLPLKFYDNTQVGEILSKATTDIDKISEVIITGFNQFVYSFLTILLGIGILFVINAQMSFIVVAVLAIGVILTGLISVLNQKLFHNNMLTLSSLSTLTEETLSGNLVVKTYSKEIDFIEKLDGKIDKQYEANKLSQFVNFSIYPAIRFVNQIAFILAALFGARFAIQGILTVGLIQAFLQYLVQISEPINNSSYVINSFQGALVSIERIQEILADAEETQYNGQVIRVDKPEGRIIFDHVSFGYSKEKLLMKDVSFEAKPNKTIAIVGPTGAGKTTLVNLLMRFYDINGGHIFFDNKDVKKISREELRKHFGMVLQDTWLFKGTVADNISYGKQHATREEIVEAAKIAQCDNFIRKLPQGYDTIISSDDGMISQGEQQLLTIARTVLSNPKVMILDEATSSIDTKTEKEIQTAIARVMQGRTSFVIAHRLSTIRNADLILVMDKGDIIEKGNHEELIQKNSFYAKLYNAQFN
ncbi:TPA: ABC transporter ATP-binding protein [Enterococcus faecalis]|uniref:ABC transporter ATP-binding protein n=1 Tax=Enterococcus faecalis TaxID=1351 RepID=UPI001F2AC0C2|nr:ABC transporter ATP-binding protein [Enterococcus faecalis]UJQ88667.1 ABC transporter ATP-binding protein/permease [Enterococcus faecalis]HAP4450107.1 ABC transporter ATP-binding protein [Enterococcus faecalis]HAP4459148.1 ABC transporter ATP-binding protein [Enterococcus faecalis]HAP4462380.1 ABC transporter ATP-binding protein [Enterococcus faecalis]HAP4471607.1 ABC transporter ATP-binding protein [Enterococcus faecalis]